MIFGRAFTEGLAILAGVPTSRHPSPQVLEFISEVQLSEGGGMSFFTLFKISLILMSSGVAGGSKQMMQGNVLKNRAIKLSPKFTASLGAVL